MNHSKFSLKLLLVALCGLLAVTSRAADAPAPDYYYLCNVATGQYLTKGNKYGTQASITETIAEALTVELVPSGASYQIRTAVGSTGWGLEVMDGSTTVYTDQSRDKVTAWAFRPVTLNDGMAYNIISAENHKGGSGYYLVANGDDTVVGPNADADPSSGYAQWKLIPIEGTAELRAAMSSASPRATVNATALIHDASFSENYGEKYKDKGAMATVWSTTDGVKEICGGAESNRCAESFHSAVTLEQVLKGLPAGVYGFSAQGFYREDGEKAGKLPVFYANDKTAAFPVMSGKENSMNDASASFTEGLYTIDPIFVTVEAGGTLAVGVKGEATEQWVIWDNFQLTYYGDVDAFYAQSIAEGDYYIQNVASGLYLGAANAWGTQASLVKHGDYVTFAKVGDGSYTLESRSSNGDTRHYLGFDNGYYLDNGNPRPLFITCVDRSKGIWTIEDETGVLAWDGTSTLLSNKGDVNDQNSQWYLVSKAAAAANLSKATVEQPQDATFLIADPNYSRNNRDLSAWIVSEDCTNKNLSGGKYENCCAESYHSVFTISQELKDVPNGVYGLKAQGFYRQDGNDVETIPVFFANAATTPFPAMGNLPDYDEGGNNSMADASVAFLNGDYPTDPIYVKVEDGTLTLGVKGTAKNQWAIWDNFELTYYGDTTVPEVAYPTLYKEFLALQSEAIVIVKATTLEAVKDLLGWTVDFDVNTLQSEAEFTEKIAQLTNEISQAKKIAEEAIADAVKELNVLADQLQAQVNASEQYEVASADLATNTSAVITAIKGASYTSLEAVENGANRLIAAAKRFFAGITPKGDFDVTDWFIINPTPVANRAVAEGWEGDAFWDSTNGVSEYWNMAAASFHQTLSLPAGQYKLTVEALTRTDMTATLYAGTTNMAIATVAKDVVDNRAQAAAWFNAGNGKNELTFTVASAGDLTIGLKAEGTIADYWMVWRSFKLDMLKAADEPIIVDPSGDVNNDDVVDVQDYREVLNYILDSEDVVAYVERYDINSDKAVNVADASAIVNIMLYGKWYGPEEAQARAAFTPVTDVLTFTEQGDRYVLSLNNAGSYTALQMDVVIPAGMTLLSEESSGSHSIMTRRLSNGATRIIVFSASNEAFASQELLTLHVSGQGTLTAKDVLFSDCSAHSVMLSLSDATGINGVTRDAFSGEVFDLSGRKVSAQGKGIHIVRSADGSAKKVLK